MNTQLLLPARAESSILQQRSLPQKIKEELSSFLNTYVGQDQDSKLIFIERICKIVFSNLDTQEMFAVGTNSENENTFDEIGAILKEILLELKQSIRTDGGVSMSKIKFMGHLLYSLLPDEKADVISQELEMYLKPRIDIAIVA